MAQQTADSCQRLTPPRDVTPSHLTQNRGIAVRKEKRTRGAYEGEAGMIWREMDTYRWWERKLRRHEKGVKVIKHGEVKKRESIAVEHGYE